MTKSDEILKLADFIESTDYWGEYLSCGVIGLGCRVDDNFQTLKSFGNGGQEGSRNWSVIFEQRYGISLKDQAHIIGRDFDLLKIGMKKCAREKLTKELTVTMLRKLAVRDN